MSRTLVSLGLHSFLGLLSVIAFGTPAFAFETRGGDAVHIKEGEVIEGDLYAFAEKIKIDGTVKGDLIAFGGEIVVKGTVEGDIAAAGQSILIEGQIGDDARLAGQVIKLAGKSQIKGDVVAAGFSFEQEDEAKIGGELAIAGYQADLSGDIQGKVMGALANCRLAGTVTGDIQLEVGVSDGPAPVYGPPPAVAMPKVPGGLTIDSTANLKGKLAYTSSREAKIDEDAELANEAVFTHEKDEPKVAPTTTERVLSQVRRLLTVGLLGLVMVMLLPRWTAGWSDSLRSRPLMSIAGGFLGIFIFFVALIMVVALVAILAGSLAAATLGEMSLVVVVLGLLSSIGLSGGFWLVTVYLATAIAGLTLGRLIVPSKGTTRVIVPFLIGFVLLAAISSIPIVGHLIGWIAMLGGLGALGIWWFQPRPPETFAMPAGSCRRNQ